MLNMLLHLSIADVIIIGEQHNDPVAHYIELEVVKGVSRLKGTVAVSMEMFERDVQHIVDEYLRGEISEEFLIKDARAWDNYESDYKSVLEFAKDNNFPVIAANAPRRYIRTVSSEGIEKLNSLSSRAKRTFAPLPLEFPDDNAYRDKFFREMQQPSQGSAPSAHGSQMSDQMLLRIFQAQVLWDATMAYSIGQYYMNNPQVSIVHFNGAFHSDHRMGVVDHLQRDHKDMQVITISVIPSTDYPNFNPEKIENIADFAIITDKSLQFAIRN